MTAGVRLTDAQAEDEMRAAGFKPIGTYQGVDKKWLVKCMTCEEELERTLSNVRAGKGCKHCKGHVVDPAAAKAEMLAAGFEPLGEYPGSNKPWKSRCATCGKEPAPTLNTVRNGHGCKFCKGVTLDPDAVKAVLLEAGLEPLEAYPGRSNDRWRIRCMTCNAKTTTSLDLVRAGSGCQDCGRRRAADKRRLDEPGAIKEMLAKGYRPLTSYFRADEPWPSECLLCGNLRTPRFTAVRIANGYGCPVCRGLKIDPHAAKARMTAAGLKVKTDFPGVNEPWESECAVCAFPVSPTLANIQRGQGGCRRCARRFVDPAAAVEIMRQHGFEPQTDYPGAGEPWSCACLVCGQQSTPSFNNVQAKGTGCRFCAKYGFDLKAPAQLYLLEHPCGALKIGVTNTAQPNARIGKHRRNGWTFLRALTVEAGVLAFAIEQQVLRRIRREFDPNPYMTPETMPQGGSTETFDVALLDAEAAWDLVLEVRNAMLIDIELPKQSRKPVAEQLELWPGLPDA